MQTKRIVKLEAGYSTGIWVAAGLRTAAGSVGQHRSGSQVI